MVESSPGERVQQNKRSKLERRVLFCVPLFASVLMILLIFLGLKTILHLTNQRLTQEGIEIETDSFSLIAFGQLVTQGDWSPHISGLRFRWQDTRSGRLLATAELDHWDVQLALAPLLRGQIHLQNFELSGLRVRLHEEALESISTPADSERSQTDPEPGSKQSFSSMVHERIAGLPGFQISRILLKDLEFSLFSDEDLSKDTFRIAMRHGVLFRMIHERENRSLRLQLSQYESPEITLLQSENRELFIPIQNLQIGLDLAYGGRRDPLQLDVTKFVLSFSNWRIHTPEIEFGASQWDVLLSRSTEEQEESCRAQLIPAADSGFEQGVHLNLSPCALSMGLAGIDIQSPQQGLKLGGQDLSLSSKFVLQETWDGDLSSIWERMVLPSLHLELEVLSKSQEVASLSMEFRTVATGRDQFIGNLRAHLGRLEKFLSERDGGDAKGTGFALLQEKAAAYRRVLHAQRVVSRLEVEVGSTFVRDLGRLAAQDDLNKSDDLMDSWFRSRPVTSGLVLSYRNARSDDFPEEISSGLMQSLLRSKGTKDLLGFLQGHGPEKILSFAPFALIGTSLQIEENRIDYRGRADAEGLVAHPVLPVSLGQLSATWTSHLELWPVGGVMQSIEPGSWRAFLMQGFGKTPLSTWLSRPVRTVEGSVALQAQSLRWDQEGDRSPQLIDHIAVGGSVGLLEEGRVRFDNMKIDLESGSMRASWKADAEMDKLLSSGDLESEWEIDAPQMVALPFMPELSLEGQMRLPIQAQVQLSESSELDSVRLGADMFFKKVKIRLNDGLAADEPIFELRGIDGRLPLFQELKVLASEPGSTFPFRFQWEPFLEENPFRRAGGAKLSGLYSASRNLYVKQVQFKGRSGVIGPLAASVALKQNQLLVDELNGEAFGGYLSGQSYLTLKPGGLEMAFSGRISGLDGGVLLGIPGLARDDAILGGRAALVFDLSRSDVEGRVDLDRVPRPLLDQLLIRVDPSGSNSAIGAARLALGIAAPGRIEVEMQNGLADMTLEIIGATGDSEIRIPALPISRVLEGHTSDVRRSLEEVIGTSQP